jgi:hypothetical protein
MKTAENLALKQENDRDFLYFIPINIKNKQDI